MIEYQSIDATSKDEQYALVYRQIESLVGDECDDIANMANIASILHHAFHFWWTGFYRVKGEELILGPFQGPPACCRIGYGKGVCGTAWRERCTQVVPDVEQFEGHIACSSQSRSEIVVPIWRDEDIVAVLDIDSERVATFDDTDRKWLELIVALLS